MTFIFTVFGQGAVMAVASPTHLTHVGLCARVGIHVQFELVRVPARLIAHRTHFWAALAPGGHPWCCSLNWLEHLTMMFELVGCCN